MPDRNYIKPCERKTFRKLQFIFYESASEETHFNSL